MRYADHHPNDRRFSNVWSSRAKWKSILWFESKHAQFLNPLLWPLVTRAHARSTSAISLSLSFLPSLATNERSKNMLFAVSKWCVTNQWISYYLRRSERKLNASASFSEKINIFFLNFTLDREKRMNFCCSVSPSHCTRAHRWHVENRLTECRRWRWKMFKLILFFPSLRKVEWCTRHHLKCAALSWEIKWFCTRRKAFFL